MRNEPTTGATTMSKARQAVLDAIEAQTKQGGHTAKEVAAAADNVTSCAGVYTVVHSSMRNTPTPPEIKTMSENRANYTKNSRAVNDLLHEVWSAGSDVLHAFERAYADRAAYEAHDVPECVERAQRGVQLGQRLAGLSAQMNSQAAGLMGLALSGTGAVHRTEAMSDLRHVIGEVRNTCDLLRANHFAAYSAAKAELK